MQIASRNNKFHRLILIALFYPSLFTELRVAIRYLGQNWFYLLVTGFYWTCPNTRNTKLKLGLIIRSTETLSKWASETHISISGLQFQNSKFSFKNLFKNLSFYLNNIRPAISKTKTLSSLRNLVLRYLGIGFLFQIMWSNILSQFDQKIKG